MSSDQSYTTSGQYGLSTLTAPSDAVADIVFVHGLTGNRETTWTHKKSGVLWPKTLLPEDLQKASISARVFTFGYDADVVGLLQTSGSNRVRDHGKTLAEELAMLRKRSITNKRPLLFVVHSMGGLVCEQALLISRDSADKHVNELLEATYAIAFMGTPHHGSDKANWTKVLRNLSGIFRYTNKDILAVLEPGSEMLANLQQMFHIMLERRAKEGKPSIEIFCFYEEVGVLGIGEIVPSHSAILPRYGNKSIHANHMDMTKFESAESQGFQDVSGRLWLWLDTIREAAQRNTDVGITPGEVERRHRIDRFATIHDVSDEVPSQRFGTVNSGGGAVFQGNGNVTMSPAR